MSFQLGQSLWLGRDYYLDLTTVFIHNWVDWYSTSIDNTNPIVTSEIWTVSFRTIVKRANHWIIQTHTYADGQLKFNCQFWGLEAAEIYEPVTVVCGHKDQASQPYAPES